ncbi:MAG TPA: FecR family protein [Elusimicrobiota bacterium]|nr:FecR family protein [Elusimicrobiota bacterium]
MEILTRRLLAVVLLAYAPAARAATVITLVPNGLVDVRTGKGDWRPVGEAETVTAGQTVRTHRNATAELRFSDGSRIQLQSYAIFAIDKTDRQETGFSLKMGKLKAAFAGLLSSKISIHTPTAVCAVRGTVFELGVENKNTEVTMAEGVLEVKDDKGHQAVVTSEETMKVGVDGMEKPRMLRLNDNRALPAVRPYAVHQEMARAATRTMLEDVRNRELKANEAQLGKNVVDAFGRRVRLEEYVLRPDANSFELLFLNSRQGSFNWGHYLETFAAPIPNDLSQIPAIVASGIMAPNQPSNWLKSIEFYATNTLDAEKELFSYGDPVQINFAGFGKGVLWYPSSIVETQTLYGPGVPNGQRVQFQQLTDYNQSNPGLFTWIQYVQAGSPAADNLQPMFAAVMDPAQTDPTNALSPAKGGNVFLLNLPVYNNTNTTFSFPNGPSKTDLLASTTYADGSTLSVEKFLLDDAGKILSLNPSGGGVFSQSGSYNLEFKIDSSLFQGRSIDVLLAPSIIQQTGQAASTPDKL